MLGVERGVGTNLPVVTDNLDALGEKVSAKSLTGHILVPVEFQVS